MRVRTSLAAALAGAALVTGAGCGGDDSEGEKSGGGALTAAEYRQQGNALCKKAASEVEGILAPSSPEGLPDYLEKVFGASKKVTDEFVKLEPPQELRADHEQAVKLSLESEKIFDALIERVREAPNPQAAVLRELRTLAPELEKAEKVNTRLGLDECNETGPPAQQPDPS